MKKTREFVFEKLGWFLIELSMFIATIIPDECDKCYKFLGGDIFYKLGTKSYVITYDLN